MIVEAKDVLLENVETYQNKNGEFGANVTFSNVVGKVTKRLDFNIKDDKQAKSLKEYIGDRLPCIIFEIDQNRFGLRLGQIVHIEV